MFAGGLLKGSFIMRIYVILIYGNYFEDFCQYFYKTDWLKTSTFDKEKFSTAIWF